MSVRRPKPPEKTEEELLALIPKNKGGQPKKVLDKKLIHDLAMIHCTKKEIATICGCSIETLYANYSDVLQKGDDEGKKSLKRMMHEKAMKGDTTMLIWLSKQRLGYRDKQPDEATHIQFNVMVQEVPK